MRKTNCFLIAFALAAPALAKDRPTPVDPKGEAELAKLLKDRVPGTPIDCIQQRDIQSSHTIDHTAIVYEVGSRYYVNRPQIGAEQLERDDILLTDTHSDRLCRIDTVRLIDQAGHFERGFVGLGDFVPYTKVKTPK